MEKTNCGGVCVIPPLMREESSLFAEHTGSIILNRAEPSQEGNSKTLPISKRSTWPVNGPAEEILAR